MDALFIVPAMVSQNVNEKVVPALAKVIERNILLNNSSMFRDAALIRYKSSFNRKGLRLFKSENSSTDMPVIFLSEYSIGDDFFKSLNKELLDSLVTEAPKPPASGGDMDDLDAEYKKLKGDIVRLYDVAYKQAKAASGGNKDIFDREFKNRTAKADGLSKAFGEHAKKRIDARSEALGNAKDERSFKLELMKFNKELSKDASLMLKNRADAKSALLDVRKTQMEIDRMKDRAKYSKGTRSADLDYFKGGNQFTSIDQIEIPKGITFFSQISLEPTILEVPISYNMSRDPEDGQEFKIIRIGIKCIPYMVDDVKSILRLLKESKVMNSIERFFKNKFRDIQTKIPFSTAKAINKGDINPDEASNTVKFSPTAAELSSPGKLAKLLRGGQSSPWSTMIILSSFDFKEESEILDMVKNYRAMTKYVIGDLVITNETKESAYFCTTKMGNCQELSFEYLKKVLNLNNVLDASITSRHRAAAFAMHKQGSETNIKSAVFEHKSNLKKISKLLES
jgi:hypothetical protein